MSSIEYNANSNNNSNNGGKEVIHIAIGDVSCMVMTHLQNLNGLSCTTTTSSTTSTSASTTPLLLCNSTPTHTIYQDVLVPRTLLIGNMIGNRIRWNNTNSHLNPIINSNNNNNHYDPSTAYYPTEWNGKPIEMISNYQNYSINANSNNDDDNQYHDFYSRATQIAYSQYSRYRISTKNDTVQRQQQQYKPSSNNHRHVNWDDDDDDNEHEDLDDIDDQDRREEEIRKQRMEWNRQYQDAQNAMDVYWNNDNDNNNNNNYNNNNQRELHNSTNATNKDQIDYKVSSSSSSKGNDSNDTIQQQQQQFVKRTWYDYLIPPYHPNTCIDISSISSPNRTSYSTDNNNSNSNDTADTMNSSSYYSTLSNNEITSYIYDVVWEQYIRLLLEQCDSCQGLLLLQDHGSSGDSSSGIINNNISASGWGTQILQLWNDECSHTVQCTIPIMQNHTNHMYSNDPSKNAPTQVLQQQQQRAAIRSLIEQGLVLSDQSALSTTFLPIEFPSSDFNTTEEAAAMIAMAIESSTLPYRIVDGTNTSRSQLALQSYYGGGNYGTIPNLSFREYIRTMLRQSASKNILELDCMVPYYDVTSSSSSQSSLLALLQQGTSIERDQRMKQSRGYHGSISRPVDVAPGEWMNSVQPSKYSNQFMISSLSPQPTGMTYIKSPDKDNPRSIYDRNLHYHYALSTSLRLPSQSNTADQTKTSDFVTCIMESMGIRYRPEQAICTVLDQSYTDLVLDGYGAGSYWKSIFRNSRSSSSLNIESNSLNTRNQLILNGMISVLGNTTRIYPYLAETTMNIEHIINPKRNSSGKQKDGTMHRSYYNRDAMSGLVPEVDDCMEAISNCLDIRDSYEPPQGSGLIQDDDGDFFD